MSKNKLLIIMWLKRGLLVKNLIIGLALFTCASSFADDFSNCINLLNEFNHNASYADVITSKQEQLAEGIIQIAALEGVKICTKTELGRVEFYATGISEDIQNFNYEIRKMYFKTLNK